MNNEVVSDDELNDNEPNYVAARLDGKHELLCSSDRDIFVINSIRGAIIAGLSFIPKVGAVLAKLISIFWPESKKDIWEEIKAKVEAMVNKKIDDAVFEIVQNFLIGLGNNLHAYQGSLNMKTPNIASENFVACHHLFINEIPQFQSNSRKVQLLPLFVHFGSLHLMLLRSAVLNSKLLGWNAEVAQYYARIATELIKKYTDYVNATYQQAYEDAKKKANDTPSPHYTSKFDIINDCARTYQITVLDFSEMYQYFDPTTYPGNVRIELKRTVYSKLVGTNDDAREEANYNRDGRIAGLCPPTSISLYSGGNRRPPKGGCQGAVVGFTVRYPGGFGPWKNSNNFQGRYLAGKDDHIYMTYRRENPVVAVRVGGSGGASAIYSMQLEYKDGTHSPVAGGCNGNQMPNTRISVGKDHVLVDIMWMSNSKYYGCMGCLAFGFQLENYGCKKVDALPMLYSCLREEKIPDKNELTDAFKEMPVCGVGDELEELDVGKYVEDNIELWENEYQASRERCARAYQSKLSGEW